MKVETILTGSAGIAGTALANTLNINDLSTALVQLVVGIITIVKLLQKPKNGETTVSDKKTAD